MPPGKRTTAYRHSTRPGPFQATPRRRSSTPGMATTPWPSLKKTGISLPLLPHGVGIDTNLPPKDTSLPAMHTLPGTMPSSLQSPEKNDDALLWAPTIEEAFHQATEWLDVCGRNGITLNLGKFRFALDEVEFAGFEIRSNRVASTSEQ